MKAIVTTKSVVLSTPATDAKGKPVTEKVKWGNREREHHIHDHVQHPADTVLTVGDETDALGKIVSKELAEELVAEGHARETVVGLDDDVSPVKTDDVLS